MKQEIIDLLESKEFYELTQKEKDLVLSQISEESYSNQRQLLLKVQGEMLSERKTLIAPIASESAAFAHLVAKNKSKKKLLILPIFSYRIPAWTAVAASILLYFALSGLFSTQKNESNVNEYQLAQADTVFIEKSIIDTIYLQQPVITENAKKNRAKNDSDFQHIDQTTKKHSTQVIQFSKDELALLGELEGGYEPLDFKLVQQGKSLNDDKIGQLVVGR